jgi:hypothetical protein
VSADVKALTNLGAAVAALITALSGLAVTGLLERAQRDEGGLLLLAFVLVVFAAVVWVAAALFEGPRNVFQIIAVVMFGAGLLVGIGALIKTQDITPRPRLNAALDQKGLLTGSVTAEGLKSADRIAIFVDGLQVTVDPNTRQSTFGPATNLFQTFAGPDRDGKVEIPIHVLLPAGTYGAIGVRAWTTKKTAPCQYPEEVDLTDTPIPSGRRIGAGCLVIPLTRIPRRPHLQLQWSGAKQRAVDVSVSATNSPTDRLLVVQVVAASGSRRRIVERIVVEPDERGVAKDSWHLTVGPKIRTICAKAAFVEAPGLTKRPTCPVAGPGGTAAAVAQLSRLSSPG